MTQQEPRRSAAMPAYEPAEYEPSPRSAPPAQTPFIPPPETTSPWVGLVLFAAIMMLLVGGFEIIDGVVALANRDYYLVSASGLALSMNYTAWGWTHLALGGLSIAAGIGIISGQLWARVVGMVLAGLGALANLLFLAAYPIWSTLIIALDVLIIYALAAHGRELRH